MAIMRIPATPRTPACVALLGTFSPKCPQNQQGVGRGGDTLRTSQQPILPWPLPLTGRSRWMPWHSVAVDTSLTDHVLSQEPHAL